MPIAFSCSCGRALRVRDELAGKRARCPGCAAVLDVPAAPGDAEGEVLEEAAPDDRGTGVTTGPRPPRRRPAPAARPDDEDDYPDLRRSRRPRRDKDLWERLNPSLFTGLGMMAFSVVPTVGLLFLDIFSCWTPILFIAGLVAFIRGLVAAFGGE